MGVNTPGEHRGDDQAPLSPPPAISSHPCSVRGVKWQSECPGPHVARWFGGKGDVGLHGHLNMFTDQDHTPPRGHRGHELQEPRPFAQRRRSPMSSSAPPAQLIHRSHGVLVLSDSRHTRCCAHHQLSFFFDRGEKKRWGYKKHHGCAMQVVSLAHRRRPRRRLPVEAGYPCACVSQDIWPDGKPLRRWGANGIASGASSRRWRRCCRAPRARQACHCL